MKYSDDMNELPAMRFSQADEAQSPSLHPLTRAQRRILFGEQSWPGTPFANLGFIVRFERTIDPVVLEAAIHSLLKRHDGLRLQLTSAKHDNETQSMQYVAPFKPMAVEQCDFSAPNSSQKLAQWAETQTRIPFTLYDAPLYRFTLLKLPEGKWGYYLKLHHIISDGWTLGLVTDEIRTEIMGGSCPDSPPSYCEYIADEFSYLSSPAYEADRTFWANKLASVPTSSDLHLPTKKRSGIRSHRRHIRFPEKLRQQIQNFCQTETTTIFRVCLGALYVFMARSLDRYDVTVAAATHGRTTASLQQMAGMFVGTFPMRICVPGENSFRDLLASLRKDLREILANHQRYPYEDLIRDLRAAGVDPGGFASVSIVGHPERYPEDMSVMNLSSGHETAAMVLHVFTDGNFGGGEIDLMMDCQADLFSTEEMACMERALLTILDEATRSSDLLQAHTEPPIAALSLVSPKDRQQLLIDWNATATPLPKSCVHQLFETKVKATPNATAVVFENESLTYAQLNTRANQLAHHLISLGVKADDLVAIAMERSPALIVALLAVLKTGGAYVPLDPEYPAERLTYMLEDCGAQILVTRKGLRERLPQSAAHTLCLDKDWATIAAKPQTNPDRLVSPEQLAYVIYTSGSTGKPKGVAIEHRGLSNLAQAQSRCFGITPNSRVGQFASISFDASVSEVMMTLCFGAALYLPNSEEHQAGKPLWQYLEEIAITHLTLPPAALAVLPQQPLQKLTHLIVAGEPCLPALAKHWSKGRRFFNAYGPTETTVCATIAECAHADIDTDAALSIGRPIANTQIYILDRHNQPTPIGVAGELHIGGAGLARGYLNRSELTAEKFIPDPFSDTPNARLYKTGDLVRYRTDGNIEFLGRIDHQVKIRGFRIELGEIETALAGHPDVRDAVVIARCEENGEKRLVAYLVADQRADAKELRAFLKNTLPDYMLPAAFVYLETLPLTPNGKVDRKALPEPKASAAQHDAVAPRDDLEQIMTDLWSSVLSRPYVGIHDNFFELGGHSLLATQLTSRLRDKLAVEVPVRWLFEAPTVAELTERIRTSRAHCEHVVTEPDNVIPANTLQNATDRRPLIDLSQAEIDQIARTVEGGADNIQDIYPMAPLQEGILFHHMLQDSRDAYLSHLLLAFDSRVRCEAFIAALQTVINRHDILRTSVVWKQLPEPVQVVWRQVILPVEILEFDPAVGSVAEQLMEYCQPQHSRIDLTKAPLLRIVLAQDTDRWLLIFLSHHLVMDHTTLGVMLEEIEALLQGNEALLTPPVPFRNFVAQSLGGISTAEHEFFFSEMLRDIDTPTAPFDLMDVQGDGSQMVEAKHELPADLALRMRQQVRGMGVTPAALCHLAWALVLSRCCNQEDVVFGTVLFGRMQGGAGIERALGMFINTLPLRITCDARTTIEALRETQQQLLALMRHEHASLTLAQRCSAVQAPMPLFSALLNYRHSAPNNSAPLLEGVEILQAEERTNFPFGLSIDDLGEGFSLTVQVDLSISPTRICIYMQQALQALVTALENTPQTPLNQLNILPAEEQQQLLIDWNATHAPLPKSCVHQLFEAQVRATSNASAVVFENETLTYERLNTRANQLAHHLLDLGVETETLVAVALQRSPDMIVTLLAILKAGGAYVPLDPEYPAQRLAYMLEDCGAQILITQESLRDQLPKSAAHTLCLDTDRAAIADQPQSNPDGFVSPDNLAYVIYTSGSTGRPKGVAMPHAPLCNLIAWQLRNTPEVSANTLQYTTLSFDVSFQEIFCTLTAGGCLFLIENNARRDSSELLRLIENYKIGRVFMPYVALADLSEVAIQSDVVPHTLRAVFTAGEQLRITPAIARLFEKTGASLHNHYGPTESHVVTAFSLGEDVAQWPTLPSIGRPIANTQLYILDRHNQPTPIGVPGELHIGGATLARGYLNRPELTAAKFIADPFSDLPGARLYKTGDLVRYRTDGNIEFLGRLDHQVKIRGFRIELGEVEAALAEHPNIKEAVVIARSEASGNKRLVAYLSTDRHLDTTELRKFLIPSLPEYMLPSVFMLLEALPLTPTGKVDRKALPEPEGLLENTGYHLPRDSFEQHLIELWERVLSVRPIGIHDNFFDIGGHSLLAVRLISAINKTFGKHLPISRLFEFPTIAGMASLLRKGGDMPAASCLVKIRQQGSRSPLFVLPGASGMTSYLYPFAHHLGADIPFFAFQAQGLEGAQLPHTDFGEMITHYVGLLREVQPKGPYFLAGHSFGALVAFAMAQKLLVQGECIEMLTILDTHAPVESGVAENSWLRGDVPLVVLVGQFLCVIFDREITFSKESVAGLNDQEQLTFVARELAKANLLPEDDIIDHLRGLLTVFKLQLTMQDEYIPESYIPLPITLFRSSEQMMYLSSTQTLSEDFGWGQYSSRPVPIHYVPGNHVTMMTLPHVKKLAEQMTSEMRGLKK